MKTLFNALVMVLLMVASAFATPTLDVSSIDLGWVLTNAMILLAIVVGVKGGIWGAKRLASMFSA